MDFIVELHSRNLEHIIDQICSHGLTHRDIVNMHRVCKNWNSIFNVHDEEVSNGSIWRRILFTKCKSRKTYKYLSALNNWWPDIVLSKFSGTSNDNVASLYMSEMKMTIKNVDIGEHSANYHEVHELKRRSAIFESIDVKKDLTLNIKNKNIKEGQSRLLFVGGIVSQLSFCGPGGRYLFCGMLSGDIKMWELWNINNNDGKRKLEVLGRAWKIFKGHEERINALDFLELNGIQGDTNKGDIVFASASDDHSFRVWSFQTGAQLRVVRSGTGTRIHSILLLEDYILTASSTVRSLTHTHINLFKVGGCRTKTKDIDLSWWDSIEIISTIPIENSSLTTCDVSKWDGYGRMAIVTNDTLGSFKEVIHVYTVDTNDKSMPLKEECKIWNSKDFTTTIDNISLHTHMLLYSSTNMKTKESFLTLINLHSGPEHEVWKVKTSHICSLIYISVTSSALLGIYENGDVIVSSLEELLSKIMRLNNKQAEKENDGSNVCEWPLNQPIFKSNDSLFNKTDIIVSSICLDPSGSFAFLSEGHADTVKLYFSPSVINLTKDDTKTNEENLDNDSDEEISLC